VQFFAAHGIGVSVTLKLRVKLKQSHALQDSYWISVGLEEMKDGKDMKTRIVIECRVLSVMKCFRT